MLEKSWHIFRLTRDHSRLFDDTLHAFGEPEMVIGFGSATSSRIFGGIRRGSLTDYIVATAKNVSLFTDRLQCRLNDQAQLRGTRRAVALRLATGVTG